MQLYCFNIRASDMIEGNLIRRSAAQREESRRVEKPVEPSVRTVCPPSSFGITEDDAVASTPAKDREALLRRRRIWWREGKERRKKGVADRFAVTLTRICSPIIRSSIAYT
ncbi:hypothetical protein OPV22_020326 [Ensete ventricosum]|uniref:Uncharacterized protein n=1 Tax=Ensete ventricosum TaxID=4639 RepID=A0AAV8QA15_ENSVE|nr:hypothetical protein OPV22_020326 [Ensete ventricosum]